MGKKLMLAVAMVALMAAPSFAAVQNVKVSGSIATTSVIRADFNANTTRDRQNEVFAQTHLNVSADLTDNVTTNIGLLQERLWGNAGGSDQASTGSIDLETAYVSMKEFLYSPLTVTVGRQPLKYGNQLIIGSSVQSGLTAGNVTAVPDLTDKGNFDAIKAVLTYDPLTVDLFASRISNNGTVGATGTNDIHDNVNLYGVNANYKLGDKMSTVVEAYTFLKQDDSKDNRNLTPFHKSENTFVPGLRVSTNPIEGLNVQLEGAYQMGNVWNNGTGTAMTNRDAFAFQGMVNYALPVLKNLKPVLAGAYTYLSGNKPGSTKGRAWDAMFEHQNTGRIFDTSAVGNLASSNSQLVTVSGEITPIQDLTAKASWNGLWKAEKPVDTTTANLSRYIGSEIDLDLTYAYTEDVKFGMSAGQFLTGKNYIYPNNKNATQVLSSVSVAF
ncbi:MAG: alginate export family protein [Candidatus Omnitrophica bacterium]|nr:alginate export family protein [Candidatus Omnitrophota bacterium]